jgi:hypothetical protein
MARANVRTTIDIPATLYKQLKDQAVAQGCSTRALILRGVETVLLSRERPRPRRVRFPLIHSDGPKVQLTGEQIYEHVEFP